MTFNEGETVYLKDINQKAKVMRVITTKDWTRYDVALLNGWRRLCHESEMEKVAKREKKHA